MSCASNVTIENQSLGISITHPLDWRIVENSNDLINLSDNNSSSSISIQQANDVEEIDDLTEYLEVWSANGIRTGVIKSADTPTLTTVNRYQGARVQLVVLKSGITLTSLSETDMIPEASVQLQYETEVETLIVKEDNQYYLVIIQSPSKDSEKILQSLIIIQKN